MRGKNRDKLGIYIHIPFCLKKCAYCDFISFENPDPDCDLNYSHNKITEMGIEYTLSNSLGFGGHNGVIILKKV